MTIAETLLPTPGDVIAALAWATIGAALLWGAITGARDLNLLAHDEPEPEPPPRHLPSSVRVLRRETAPFDWQHETDL